VSTNLSAVPTETSLFLETISVMVSELLCFVLQMAIGTLNLMEFTVTGGLLVILSTNMVLVVTSLFLNSTLIKFLS